MQIEYPGKKRGIPGAHRPLENTDTTQSAGAVRAYARYAEVPITIKDGAACRVGSRSGCAAEQSQCPFFKNISGGEDKRQFHVQGTSAPHTQPAQIHSPLVPGPSRNSLASPGSSDTWNPGISGESSTAAATTPLLPSTSCNAAPCAKVRLARAGWFES